jgi:hypothetical protein
VKPCPGSPQRTWCQSEEWSGSSWRYKCTEAPAQVCLCRASVAEWTGKRETQLWVMYTFPWQTKAEKRTTTWVLRTEYSIKMSDLWNQGVGRFQWRVYVIYAFPSLHLSALWEQLYILSFVRLFVCLVFWVFFLVGWGELVVVGFELKASQLLGRCCTTWATLPVLFVLFFETSSHCMA